MTENLPRYERSTGGGRQVVVPFTEEQWDASIAGYGLPPRQEGEQWHDWAERTKRQRGVGLASLKIVDVAEVESPDGKGS